MSGYGPFQFSQTYAFARHHYTVKREGKGGGRKGVLFLYTITRLALGVDTCFVSGLA
jgi:hypothetical protein